MHVHNILYTYYMVMYFTVHVQYNIVRYYYNIARDAALCDALSNACVRAIYIIIIRAGHVNGGKTLVSQTYLRSFGLLTRRKYPEQFISEL